MKVTIFDVEHGACALITSPIGLHTLIDCGFNSTTGFRPSIYLPSTGIFRLHRLIISNYDEDHINNLVHLRKQVKIDNLIRNPITTTQLKKIKSAKNYPLSESLLDLCKMMEEYQYHGEQTWPEGMYISTFYNTYPGDFDDTNNLSVVNFITFDGLCMLFAGDLEKEGWLKLLERQDFRNQLANVHVVVASHHGRENGYCEEVFKYCTPQIVIMSDKCKMHETQETVSKYGSKTSGILHLGKKRKVFTTRYDGAISIERNVNGYVLKTSKCSEL